MSMGGLRRVFADFEPLPHRLEIRREEGTHPKLTFTCCFVSQLKNDELRRLNGIQKRLTAS
jgi:hypothetical protein